MEKSKRIISHRGNLTGPNSVLENSQGAIEKALSLGFDVEIDLLKAGRFFFSGHGGPEYLIDKEFLETTGLWIHCKDIETLDYMIITGFVNFFFHEKDSCTLTSSHYIWTSPNIKNVLYRNSIAVLPELEPKWNLTDAFGICTDFPIDYSKIYKK